MASPSAGGLIDPSQWGTGNICPDGYFWNQSTGVCDGFTVGKPPPALTPRGWAWWQYLALAGSIGLGGLIVSEGYKHYKAKRS